METSARSSRLSFFSRRSDPNVMTVHEPVVIHLRDVEPRLIDVASWEYFKDKKVHWLIEMLAEMLGAFLYVYSGQATFYDSGCGYFGLTLLVHIGLGPTAAYIVGTITSQNGIGSLYTVGFSYAIGVVISITLCAATSGSHINPGLTVSLCVFRRFPIAKVARYILAQVIGAYAACLIVYLQWKDLLVAAENVLKAKGTYDTVMFTNVGPAGVFALYPSPKVNLYRVLLNEFMSNFVLGLAICGCRDPTNHFIPPAAAPWIIGFTYAVMIWGYAPTGAPANTARDVGGRLMAITIWGLKASGGTYAAISALTNTPATMLAFAVYDFLLGSSTRMSDTLYVTPPSTLLHIQ
ncbi:aquaporin-like protein [Pisolithus croceorrhizus]|nr:aquaporin-like protein [Pisolithus croceorrhizus]